MQPLSQCDKQMFVFSDLSDWPSTTSCCELRRILAAMLHMQERTGDTSVGDMLIMIPSTDVKSTIK